MSADVCRHCFKSRFCDLDLYPRFCDLDVYLWPYNYLIGDWSLGHSSWGLLHCFEEIGEYWLAFKNNAYQGRQNMILIYLSVFYLKYFYLSVWYLYSEFLKISTCPYKLWDNLGNTDNWFCRPCLWCWVLYK